jgi:hypothetical protein
MSKPLIPAQQREQVQEYPAACQTARAADFGGLFDTPNATINRDSAWLEDEVFLGTRTRGNGAKSPHTFDMQRAQNYIKSLHAMTHPIPA